MDVPLKALGRSPGSYCKLPGGEGYVPTTGTLSLTAEGPPYVGLFQQYDSSLLNQPSEWSTFVLSVQVGTADLGTDHIFFPGHTHREAGPENGISTCRWWLAYGKFLTRQKVICLAL